MKRCGEDDRDNAEDRGGKSEVELHVESSESSS